MPSAKVLIIEDDPDEALTLGVQLRNAGYTVVTTRDTGAAVQIASRERPDVILLDLGLPGGGGPTVLARLRTLLETLTTPVIVVSGSRMDRDWVLASGAHGYLAKPADPDDVIKAIETSCERTKRSIRFAVGQARADVAR